MVGAIIMEAKLHHYLNAGLSILVASAFISVMLSLFERDAGWLAHIVNIWFFVALYKIIKLKGDED